MLFEEVEDQRNIIRKLEQLRNKDTNKKVLCSSVVPKVYKKIIKIFQRKKLKVYEIKQFNLKKIMKFKVKNILN